MQRRWTVKRGPEFDQSLAECEAERDRSDLAVSAIELMLERDPMHYSEPFADDGRCVIETRDFYAELVFTVYAVLYKDFSAEMKWMMARPLLDDLPSGLAGEA